MSPSKITVPGHPRIMEGRVLHCRYTTSNGFENRSSTEGQPCFRMFVDQQEILTSASHEEHTLCGDDTSVVQART